MSSLERIPGHEPSRHRVVVPSAQIVEPEIRIPLLAPVHVKIRSRPRRIDQISECIVVVDVGDGAGGVGQLAHRAQAVVAVVACLPRIIDHLLLVDPLQAVGRSSSLKVFFSQNGTGGVAWVYVDHDGFTLVGISPALRFFFAAEPFAEVAHLRFWIVVFIGKRGLVVGLVWIGSNRGNLIPDKGDTHYLDHSGNCWPVAALSALLPGIQELPEDTYEHDSPCEQGDQNDLAVSEWATTHEENG